MKRKNEEVKKKEHLLDSILDKDDKVQSSDLKKTKHVNKLSKYQKQKTLSTTLQIDDSPFSVADNIHSAANKTNANQSINMGPSNMVSRNVTSYINQKTTPFRKNTDSNDTVTPTAVILSKQERLKQAKAIYHKNGTMSIDSGMPSKAKKNFGSFVNSSDICAVPNGQQSDAMDESIVMQTPQRKSNANIEYGFNTDKVNGKIKKKADPSVQTTIKKPNTASLKSTELKRKNSGVLTEKVEARTSSRLEQQK